MVLCIRSGMQLKLLNMMTMNLKMERLLLKLGRIQSGNPRNPKPPKNLLRPWEEPAAPPRLRMAPSLQQPPPLAAPRIPAALAATVAVGARGCKLAYAPHYIHCERLRSSRHCYASRSHFIAFRNTAFYEFTVPRRPVSEAI